MEQLKPCPFCGSCERDDDSEHYCAAQTDSSDSQDAAKDIWNTRSAVRAEPVKGTVTDEMVDRFLGWPLPASVCSDMCATVRNYEYSRSGTNLMNFHEAKAMLEYVLAPESPSAWDMPLNSWEPGAEPVKGTEAGEDGA